MDYLTRLTKCVEGKIDNLLPDKFALVFDGWSDDSTHFVGVFASYPSKSEKLKYQMHLLGFSLVEEECHLDTREYVDYLARVLELFGKPLSNVCCLVGDKANLNKAITDSNNIPLVECAIRRLDLGVKQFLESEKLAIKKIDALTSKLGNLKLGAELRKLTNLLPRMNFTNRWSGTHVMLLRYERLREFLLQLKSSEIDAMMLTLQEDLSVE